MKYSEIASLAGKGRALPPTPTHAQPASRSMAAEESLVRIHLLGGFRVWVGSHAIDDGAWRLRKSRAVIKLLALTPQRQAHREQVLEHLWPDLTPEAALNNLHQTLHIARRAFSLPFPAGGAPAFLTMRDQVLALAPTEAAWVDVDAFEEAATFAANGGGIDVYEKAVSLYGGELLPEDRFEEWVVPRRDILQHRYLALLIELSRLYEGSGEHTRAADLFSEVLQHDPAHEEAHSGLMRLFARTGRRQEALKQFDRLQTVLHDELQVEPHQSIIQLRDAIMAGQIPSLDSQLPAPIHLDGRRHTAREAQRERPAPRLGNLPAPLTRFVGRARELEQLSGSLRENRLITLTGPGGCGKTRLALEMARSATDAFSDGGVWWVDLAPLSDPDLVPRAVATALGIREHVDETVSAALTERLGSTTALLVIDNCEHLLEATATLVESLLSRCRNLKILVTGREGLGLTGEIRWPVPSLTLPPPNASLSTTEMETFEAVQLFVARSRAAHPAFVMTPAVAAAVGELCRRLDGLPLAIELAAAQIRSLAPDQILSRLDDRFRLLSLPRSPDTRHRSLQAALDWSYEPLDHRERTLFARLSVFAGSFTLDAAEAVCATEDSATDVLDTIVRLVDKSLVSVGERPDGEVGYRLLETIREYARRRLQGHDDAGRRVRPELGEEHAVRARHLRWFANLGERAWSGLLGPAQPSWLDRLDADLDNIPTALEWAADGEGSVEDGLRLGTSLWLFWDFRGHVGEGRAWVEKLLAVSGSLETPERARALNVAGNLADLQHDLDAAEALISQALSLSKKLDSAEETAFALYNMAHIANARRQYDRAEALLEEGIAISRGSLDAPYLEDLLGALGEVFQVRGRHEKAVGYYEECLTRLRKKGDIWGIGVSIGHIGYAMLCVGNYAGAITPLRESFAYVSQLGDQFLETWVLDAYAWVLGHNGEPAVAARLFGASDAALKRLGRARCWWGILEVERQVELVRKLLGEDAFKAAHTEGQAIPLEQAFDVALEHIASLKLQPESAPLAPAPY